VIPSEEVEVAVAEGESWSRKTSRNMT